MECWAEVPAGSGFGVHNLPFGVFSRQGWPPRVGVAIGERVLDLSRVFSNESWFAAESLNPFMAAGPEAWARVRQRLVTLFTDVTYRAEVEPHLIPLADVELHLPFEVADYVDFYSSREHAENLGRILRPGSEPLLPNWRHLPVGYHGRAGTVVVSGTPIPRPYGQRDGDLGPTAKLDIEAEVGFVVGVPSPLGRRVATGEFQAHVFGFVLVNDWSARDIQAWEYRPLGPFLGKSFATSISPWVVPVAALETARVRPPAQDPEPLPYLRCKEPWGLDVALQVELNGHVVSRPPFAGMYWTPPQQLAHATVNGAALRTGDLMASGTVSGPRDFGSLTELTWDGSKPLELPDGTTRSFLQDGDTVRISATAPGPDGEVIGFGDVAGTIRGAPQGLSRSPRP